MGGREVENIGHTKSINFPHCNEKLICYYIVYHGQKSVQFVYSVSNIVRWGEGVVGSQDVLRLSASRRGGGRGGNEVVREKQCP